MEVLFARLFAKISETKVLLLLITTVFWIIMGIVGMVVCVFYIVRKCCGTNTQERVVSRRQKK